MTILPAPLEGAEGCTLYGQARASHLATGGNRGLKAISPGRARLGARSRAPDRAGKHFLVRRFGKRECLAAQTGAGPGRGPQTERGKKARLLLDRKSTRL